jgi:gliding motility-associated-like protein
MIEELVMKNLFKFIVVLLTYLSGLNVQAQCTLSATSSGFNAAYTQVYVLVDQNGNIVDQNTTGTFNSVANGVYQIHALNYDPANAPAPLPSGLIGSPLTGVGSTTAGCYNADFLTDFVTQVCGSCQQTLEFCDGESVVITSSGSTVGYTQTYVLVDTATGLIVATNSSGDFTSDVSVGNSYQVYALNYNPADAPSPLPTVGQGVMDVGSTSAGCYNSDFLTDYVCVSILATSTGTDVQTACDSYTWIDGNNYTASNNTATWTLTNAAGCDSVVTLDLTINNSNTGTEVVTACNNYTWIDGNTYSASTNTPTWTLTNVNGCDSVVTLNLTIDIFAAGTDIQTACDTYTWIDGNTYTSSNNTATFTYVGGSINGCDSIVTLDLTMGYSNTGTDVVTACNSYSWIDGNTYTANNNSATWTLMNASGCDSVVTLNLTISNVVNGTDVQSACETFTWIDGNTYTASTNTPTYTYVGGSVNGCDSIVTLDLTINNSVSGTDVQSACDTYTWVDGNIYSSSNNTATYTYVGGSVNGCDSIVTLDLTISETPPAPIAGSDTTYCFFDIPANMSASNTDPSGVLTWYDDQNNVLGTGSTLLPNVAFGLTEYFVTETVAGCEGPSSMVAITFEDCPEEESVCGELFVPNAFTPNTDTNNDSFGISMLDNACVEDMNLKVFDRWGKVVFSSTDPDDRWDGTFKDEELDQAVFHYVLDIKLFSENEYRLVKGNVTLIR